MGIVRRRAAGASDVAQVIRITSWSDSRLRTYRQCPKKARFLYIDKLKEPENEPMREGSRVHKEAERYVLGQTKKLDPALVNFKDEIAGLLRDRKYVKAEVQFAFTRKWGFSSWFDNSTTWLRVKLDVLHIKDGVAKVIDYKTGREKDEDAEQLDLYALAVFEAEPSVQEVHVELWYTKTGAIVGTDPEAPYTRAQVPALKKKWEKAPAKMLADETFAETPGKHCDFCFFGQAGKAQGGPGLCPR